jgi:hypothetical protein
LLHDISKRGSPFFKGKDHIHPFLSAMAVLKIFKFLKFFKIENEE